MRDSSAKIKPSNMSIALFFCLFLFLLLVSLCVCVYFQLSHFFPRIDKNNHFNFLISFFFFFPPDLCLKTQILFNVVIENTTGQKSQDSRKTCHYFFYTLFLPCFSSRWRKVGVYQKSVMERVESDEKGPNTENIATHRT